MIGRQDRENFARGLERHVVEEENILGEYRNLAGILKSGPAGLLIRLIFLDEEHHHFLLREMAERLKGSLEEKPQAGAEGVPQAEVLNLIKGLARHEEATIEDCRRLKSQSAAEETDLFDAILDALISDSEKHQRLLLALSRTMKE